MTSPALSSARAAGPFAEMPTTTTLFSISVEHRLEQIDRHDHVDVLGLALALALELQRADADQFAAVRDQRGAAPIGMRRIGEDCLVQQILPITAVLLLGGDVAGDRARASAGAADHHAIADFGIGGRAKRQRIEIDPAKRLYEAKAAHGIEAERVAFHHAAVAEMQPDRFSLGDQIADGQDQVVVDQDAVAGALGAERIRAEGVGGNDRMQPDHRGKHAIEIETVVAGAGLRRQRYFPFSQREHGESSGSISISIQPDWITTGVETKYRKQSGMPGALLPALKPKIAEESHRIVRGISRRDIEPIIVRGS